MSDLLKPMDKFKPEMIPILIEIFSTKCSLKKAAEAIGVDVNTIQRWRLADAYFDSICSRALETGYEVLADKLIGITEVYEDVNKARLESDNIKWYLSKRATAKYGDRLEVNVNQTVDIKGALANARSRVIPVRDQSGIVDAQLSETITLPVNNTTDKESGGPETGDAKALNLEDILK